MPDGAISSFREQELEWEQWRDANWWGGEREGVWERCWDAALWWVGERERLQEQELQRELDGVWERWQDAVRRGGEHEGVWERCWDAARGGGKCEGVRDRCWDTVRGVANARVSGSDGGMVSACASETSPLSI